MRVIHEPSSRPIKIWTDDVEDSALQQLKNIAKLPFVAGNGVAAMADCHFGVGSTIGSVIATRGAIIPASVGVDIGCGMNAARLNLKASQLPDSLLAIRHQIERDIPLGAGGSHTKPRDCTTEIYARNEHTGLFGRLIATLNAHPKIAANGLEKASLQVGTLGSGNHFIEMCLDENQDVWIMLHSGSRGIGNMIGRYFIEIAKAHMSRYFITLPDNDLAYFAEDTEDFKNYVNAMLWAQDYALANRQTMMALVLAALQRHVKDCRVTDEAVSCHHNYCVAAGCLVEGPNYAKPIEDVRVGDVVYAWSGVGLIPTKVRHHISTGKQETIRVLVDGGTIETTPNHKILTMFPEKRQHQKRRWDKINVPVFRWKRADELSIGELVVISLATENNGKHKNHALSQFLGAFVGDGWVRGDTTNGHDFGLAVGSNKDTHADVYLGLARNLFPEANWKNNAPGAYGISASNKSVRARLKKFGCAEPGDKRRLPYGWATWSRPARICLLSGYLDADGYGNFNGFQISTSVRELAFEIHSLSRSLGFRASAVKKSIQNTNFGKHTIWRFCIAATVKELTTYRNFTRLPNLPYKSRGLKRKQSGVQPKLLGNNVGVTKVKKIETAGKQETFDIEISHPSHGFICNGIVVHNCVKENHFGQNCWVTRKGAIRARVGDMGIIPGARGANSYIVRGKGNADSYCSAPHGAGRRMGRKEAMRRFTHQDLIDQSAGVECDTDPALIDEIRDAYKPISEVMANSADLVEVVHTLTAILNVKGK